MDKQCYKPEIWGGIECTINRVGNEFFDQLEYSGHYDRSTDIDAMTSLGIRKLRYPILWEKHQPQKQGEIDWSFSEKNLLRIREKGVDVIAGLVHHGSGPSYTDLSDPDFPYLLASYAGKVAERFPWIRYYTPVNEPLTTARFSGLYGLWYPHKKNTRGFVRMLLNELRGTVLAMKEIRKINPGAQLVQTEDLGKTYSTTKLQYQARFENERRWLTFDILCGRVNRHHRLWKHFMNLNIPEEDFLFFQENPCTPDIFGFNHYLTSERYLDENLHLYPVHTHGGNGRHRYADVEAVRVELEEESGIEMLLREAWARYHKPMAITEVHLHCHREEQLRWFRQIWNAANSLRAEGVDLRAVTSWAMLGSFGWNGLLTRPKGDYEPGAFDLRSGTLRRTALADLISNLAFLDTCAHPLAADKGWWQRSSRLIYSPVIKELRMHHDNQPSTVLILGKTGTLGRAFARVCEERSIPYLLIGRQECDIVDQAQVEAIMEQMKPWAVINATGYVRVDDAETDRDFCINTNTSGAHNLAVSCNRLGIKLVCFSSDLVFDGSKKTPYLESDKPNPLSVYGESKSRCESLVLEAAPSSLVIRTSAFFSPWDQYNFVHHIRKSLQQDEAVNVADDIFISPTYVPDLVHATLDLVVDQERGIWHLASQGAVSWAALAFMVADRFDLDRSLIRPTPSAQMDWKAKRPGYSVLGSERGHLLPTLEDALHRYMAEEKKENRQVA